MFVVDVAVFCGFLPFSLFIFSFGGGDLFGGKSLGVGSFRFPHESKMTSSVAIFARRAQPAALSSLCNGQMGGSLGLDGVDEATAISFLFSSSFSVAPSFIVVSRQS